MLGTTVSKFQASNATAEFKTVRKVNRGITSSMVLTFSGFLSVVCFSLTWLIQVSAVMVWEDSLVSFQNPICAAQFSQIPSLYHLVLCFRAALSLLQE